MIIDYIGQELIWNLTGTHPYEKNKSHYSIKIRCQTPSDNKDVKDFILKHINVSKIYDVDVFEYKPLHIYLARKFLIKNAFGVINEIEFLNVFEKNTKE